jgi:hypothetical protein
MVGRFPATHEAVRSSAIPFLSDELAVPAQDRVWRDNCANLSEHFAAEGLALDARRRLWSSLGRIRLLLDAGRLNTLTSRHFAYSGSTGSILARSIAEAADLRADTQACVEVASALACASGDTRVAARLAGAGQALLESQGARREAPDEQFIVPWVDRMREALGAEAFDSAFTAGRPLSYRAALAEARTWLEGPSSAHEKHELSAAPPARRTSTPA